MSAIVSIGTAVPGYKIPQMQIHGFMEDRYQAGEAEKRKLKVLYERSGIDTRHTVIPDYDRRLDERRLFGESNAVPGIEARMQQYHEHAGALSEAAVRDAMARSPYKLSDLTHIITVSCTGLSAPGLDIELIERLGLPANIQRTSVNFMGCYAAVHALRLAHAICNSSNARVLIVCTELCTLHFQEKNDYDNLTANAIFADGSAACIVSSEPGDGFAVKGFYSEVQPRGKQDMAWHVSSTGFLMTLSAYIPQLVEANIGAVLQSAAASFGIDSKDIAHWAIHPGGMRILEAVQRELALKQDDLQHSYEVLRQYGNMSSATILFVLKRMLDDTTMQGHFFGAAFGPGLTIETFLLHKPQARS